jgi:hypothetical protein
MEKGRKEGKRRSKKYFGSREENKMQTKNENPVDFTLLDWILRV